MATPRRADLRTLYVAEPPARYDQRPAAVVDASLVAALLFAEPEQAAAAQRMSTCRPTAPDLLPYELANVAVNKLRRGDAEAAVRASLAELAAIGIEWHAVEPTLALDLAARYRLTAYDAAYLVLAARLKAPLLTFDRRLGEAAATHLAGLE